MHFLAVTDDTLKALLVPLVAAIAGAITTAIPIMLQQRNNERNRRADDERATRQRDQVKNDLKTNTALTTDIHRQTNGERSEELRNTAEALRKLANNTGSTEDAAAALAAETRYKEHERGLAARGGA